MSFLLKNQQIKDCICNLLFRMTTGIDGLDIFHIFQPDDGAPFKLAIFVPNWHAVRLTGAINWIPG